VLAVLSTAALVLTAVMPNWIEQVFDVSPDAGNGETEWGLVTVLVVATAAFVVLAWRDHRLGKAAEE